MDQVEQAVSQLATRYSKQLQLNMDKRILEMKDDNLSHQLLYRVLGISDEEGALIDLYQNKGRFLYKYAGAFLENAVMECFLFKFPQARKEKILNSSGNRPKTFEIDCLMDQDAFEIKWRDATTDGDHITKEHTRIRVISTAGYKPIRLMFYNPNRTQAQRSQETLKTLYRGVNGEYYAGEEAWDFVQKYTSVGLKQILLNIATSSLSDKQDS